MKRGRVYLDHNATTPLRAEARAAMVSAMDVVGNPSSVHAEGRAAKALIERARAEVAALVGARPADVIFCGSATEGAAQILAMPWQRMFWSGVEHECISAHVDARWQALDLDAGGRVRRAGLEGGALGRGDLIVVQAGNSETGVLQPIGDVAQAAEAAGAVALIDAVQAAGRCALDCRESMASAVCLISAHKLGGPKGIAALVVPAGFEIASLIKGGGQEMNRRSGTENVIGIAGFGAASAAVRDDLARGAWQKVTELRNILERTIAEVSPEAIFIGKEADRLPTTSCMLTPGWKGETQVMQMDLAGFAISAGSACSSGKVRSSAVLQAMGFDVEAAASAIRVSLGLETRAEDIDRFAESWGAAVERYRRKVA
ncbi:MAG: cysteine desulfurase family protein [Pseudomonadota bacterium]